MAVPSSAEVRGLMADPPAISLWEMSQKLFQIGDWMTCWPAQEQESPHVPTMAELMCQWMFGVGYGFERVGCQNANCANPIHLRPQV